MKRVLITTDGLLAYAFRKHTKKQRLIMTVNGSQQLQDIFEI